ncbi:MAG: DUF1572 domain-containing protein [Bacteroidetes bacterium]|nr:MAG: DUF1572 domain-containing protein [Bacteroidota bacterium]
MESYLESIRKQFEYYKSLGDKSFRQLNDELVHQSPGKDSNSIAVMVRHLEGNMLSRWTDFLTSDGEKEWRTRDLEFESPESWNMESLQSHWEKGWNCLFEAINQLSDRDLERIIYIRNQGHTVVEAINRQLAHYAYHVGQIVYLSRQICPNEWQSLSIPKGDSATYNKDKFSQEKQRRHFTDEYLREEDKK